jgi:uncharacterized protein YbbC (DUF1343 family)
VTERRTFEPVRASIELLVAMRRQAPEKFAWRDPPYEYEHVKPPIDILYGSDVLRTFVDGGRSVDEICATWDAQEEAFARLREPFLMY